MPRGMMSKVDMLARVYKMKTALHDGIFVDKGKDWNDGANYTLDKILDILNEYYR
jgi:hypothetical protein